MLEASKYLVQEQAFYLASCRRSSISHKLYRICTLTQILLVQDNLVAFAASIKIYQNISKYASWRAERILKVSSEVRQGGAQCHSCTVSTCITAKGISRITSRICCNSIYSKQSILPYPRLHVLEKAVSPNTSPTLIWATWGGWEQSIAPWALVNLVSRMAMSKCDLAYQPGFFNRFIPLALGAKDLFGWYHRHQRSGKVPAGLKNVQIQSAASIIRRRWPW